GVDKADVEFLRPQQPIGGKAAVARPQDKIEEILLQEEHSDAHKNCRHELLNELNKEEVLKDVLSWLETRLPGE
ncbi:MAG: hypothetical protein IIT95_05535, partial [Oscillospiraceae bacterium]|nr:hypothetical protein [Oscillospiraceae bacterium]